jgi:hypothetical protein
MAKKAPETIVKTPGESKLVNMEFAADLLAGETLTGTPSISPSPSGLTVTLPITSGTKAQAKFSGGTPGTTYLISVTVQTNNGQTYEGIWDLLVAALG